MTPEQLERVFAILGVPADVLAAKPSLGSAAAIRERLDCDPLARAWERAMKRLRPAAVGSKP